MRLGLLYINAIRNVPEKYEYIKEVNLMKYVVYKNKQVELRDALLDVKVGNEKLFIRIEQGSGNHYRSVFVLMRPTMRKEAREWLSIRLAKEVKFVNEKERL